MAAILHEQTTPLTFFCVTAIVLSNSTNTKPFFWTFILYMCRLICVFFLNIHCVATR